MICNKPLKPMPRQNEPRLDGTTGWYELSLPSFSLGSWRILYDAR